MRVLLISHLLIAVIGTLLSYLVSGFDASLSFAVGAALSLINVILLNFSWKSILRKKRIALSVGVIVIKYAILGFIIYKIASKPLLLLNWFCFGLGIIVLSALITAVNEARETTDNSAEMQ